MIMMMMMTMMVMVEKGNAGGVLHCVKGDWLQIEQTGCAGGTVALCAVADSFFLDFQVSIDKH